MQFKKLQKHIIRFAKYPVLILCIYYLGKNAADIRPEQLELSFIWIILKFAPLYFLCTFLFVKNWQTILSTLEKEKRQYRDIAHIHFKTAIAKYIPSNIMHYAGRHVMGSRIGIDHATILTSNLLDLSLAVLSAALIVTVTLFAGIIKIPETLLPNYEKYNAPYMIIAGICVTVFFSFIWRKIKSRSDNTNTFILLSLLKVIAGYIIFFVASGTIFFLVFAGIGYTSFTFMNFLLFATVYICAWTLGFITPGAPGGIGVRESIMVAMLSGTIDPQSALVGAFLFRIVGILGEVIGFIFASTILKPGIFASNHFNKTE
jgi:hypothetical protein